MNLNERIGSFVRLGNELTDPTLPEANTFFTQLKSAHQENQWFSPEFCLYAVESIAKQWLQHGTLKEWVEGYPPEQFNVTKPKRVGVVMAGNIPLVGFHDMLCVLISGHTFIGKASSKDGGLMEGIVKLLIAIEPQWNNRINLTKEHLKDFDAAIATGSDNTARYFEYYFGKYPNIIRKNRHSIAVLTGDESDAELRSLADDIFQFFGLGCRSVSKLLVPKHFNFERLIDHFEGYNQLANHNKYANNYQYQRAMLLMNSIKHLDNGFVILTEHDDLGSPVGVVYYQHYQSIDDVVSYINSIAEQLQCVVAGGSVIPGSIPFGDAQQPTVSSYPDGVDTLSFLLNIS